MKINLKKLALSGILATVATLAFMLEGLFPPLILPGIRMGLSNVFILLAGIVLGAGYGYAVLVAKILLGSMFTGNISAILYALPAGVIALSLELLLLRAIKKFSVIAVSVFGAVLNIACQNITFCLISQSSEYMAYLPYLALIGIISGLTVGFCAYLLIKKLPFHTLLEQNDNLKEE